MSEQRQKVMTRFEERLAALEARRHEKPARWLLHHLHNALGEMENDRNDADLHLDEFDRHATLHGLLRHLVHHQIRIPVRPTYGPNRGELEWRRPNRATPVPACRRSAAASRGSRGRDTRW